MLQNNQNFLFQINGICEKYTKKIFENIIKVKNDDPFYMLIQQNDSILFLSIGRTECHQFELKVTKINSTLDANNEFKLAKIDLQSFKLGLSMIKFNYNFSISRFHHYLDIKMDQTFEMYDETILRSTSCKIPLLENKDEDFEKVSILTRVPQADTFLSLEFNQSNQFKLVVAQLKALKCQKVTFEIEFSKTKVDIAALYEFTQKTKMKFVFTNFKIQVLPSINTMERFTYDAKEFMTSIQQLEKENSIQFNISQNGQLVLKEQGYNFELIYKERGLIYETISVMKRVVIMDDE